MPKTAESEKFLHSISPYYENDKGIEESKDKSDDSVSSDIPLKEESHISLSSSVIHQVDDICESSLTERSTSEELGKTEKEAGEDIETKSVSSNEDYQDSYQEMQAEKVA